MDEQPEIQTPDVTTESAEQPLDDIIENKGLEHLAQIEESLEVIEKNTPTSGRAFLYGVLQGAGAVVGSVLTLSLLGYLLTLFGVLPGFGVIAHYLQGVVAQLHSRF